MPGAYACITHVRTVHTQVRTHMHNEYARARAYYEYARANVRAYARAYILFFQQLRKKIKRMFPSFDFFVQHDKCGQASICIICVTMKVCTAIPIVQ